MSGFRFRILDAAFCFAGFLWLIAAQTGLGQAPPHIGYVYPAGGQTGTTVQIIVGGQFLGSVSNGYVSGEGVTARVVEFNRPLNQKEFNDLRDRIKSLQEKRRASREDNPTNAWTTADGNELDGIAAKIAKNPPNRQGNPAIAETATILLTIATNAEGGEREIRLATPRGLSNPMRFCIGTLQEISAPAARYMGEEVERLLRQLGHPPPSVQREVEIAAPSVVNGQIMPGEVDRFRFLATKGQRLVIALQARSLVPYLADAVPGWFQATLTLSDAAGHEMAFNDDYRFNPDPVLQFEVPADGEYILQVRDSIYRGREDFVYRLSIGELPFITSVFPLGARAGEVTAVVLSGWNLTESTDWNELQQVTNATKHSSVGMHYLSVTSNGRVSNRTPFVIDALPEAVEVEPNNNRDEAQTIELPLIINGRIDRKGDADVFQFQAKGAGELVVEVQARRLGSPMDSSVQVLNEAGTLIGANDDCDDKGAGLETHHADSFVRVRLPEPGRYFVTVADAQQQGGLEFGYRLRLSVPRPGFDLRVVPSSLNPVGGIVPVTIYAMRKDGFTNEITLEPGEGSQGFTISGARIPANQDQVRCTIALPMQPASEPVNLELRGCALIDGAMVAVSATPADDCMQAFAYRHLVPAEKLLVAPHPRLNRPAGSRIAPVRIPIGKSVQVQLPGIARRFVDAYELELDDPPEGILLEDVTTNQTGITLNLKCDASKVKQSFAGNLIVTFAARPGKAQTKGLRNQAQRRVAGVLPAIPFEVVSE